MEHGRAGLKIGQVNQVGQMFDVGILFHFNLFKRRKKTGEISNNLENPFDVALKGQQQQIYHRFIEESMYSKND